MLVAIVLAAAVILGGTVVVAIGLGGELARESGRKIGYPDFETAADVARYRPPASLLGYDARATEQALQLIGRTIADRDAEIAWLRGRLRELMPEGVRQDRGPAGLSSQDAATVADQVGRGEPMMPAEPSDDGGYLLPADNAASWPGGRPRTTHGGDDE